MFQHEGKHFQSLYLYLCEYCDLGKHDESKDCIVDSENKVLFGVTVKNIYRGLFLSNHPWHALVTCGYMSLLALLNFLFDLPQSDSILLTLSSQSFPRLNLLSVNNGTICLCLYLNFLPFPVEFILDHVFIVPVSKPSSSHMPITYKLCLFLIQ